METPGFRVHHEDEVSKDVKKKDKKKKPEPQIELRDSDFVYGLRPVIVKSGEEYWPGSFHQYASGTVAIIENKEGDLKLVDLLGWKVKFLDRSDTKHEKVKEPEVIEAKGKDDDLGYGLLGDN